MNLIGQPIAVIGLGYVGLPLAVEFGKRYPVTGFDIKPERIAELQAWHGGHPCPPQARRLALGCQIPAAA